MSAEITTAPAQPATAAPRTRWGVILGLWSIPALLGAVERYMMTLEAGKPLVWSQFLVLLFFWYSWALLTPVVFSLTRRFPISQPRRLRAVLIHVLAGSVIVVFFGCGLTLLDFLLPGEEQAPLTAAAYLARAGRAVAMGYAPMLLLYWALFGVATVLELRRRYREGLLRASQLERRLVESRLETLRMQLQPHFLFNTLHAISALMDHDVATARKMIARLSDLLRLTLAPDGPREVPLEQEIEVLERYLDIERVRFGDRLRVDYAVDDEALPVRVPSLILQPLVENAVRYGVAPVSRPGRIRIGARIDGATLWLTVADDGPGPGRPGVDAGEGIGLANTRARLEQLYGAAGRLELAEGGGRGFEARISVPVQGPTAGLQAAGGA